MKRPASSTPIWGPSHQTDRPKNTRPAWFWRPVRVALILWATGVVSVAVLVAALAGWLVIGVVVQIQIAERARRNSPRLRMLDSTDPLKAVNAEITRRGAVFISAQTRTVSGA